MRYENTAPDAPIPCSPAPTRRPIHRPYPRGTRGGPGPLLEFVGVGMDLSLPMPAYRAVTAAERDVYRTAVALDAAVRRTLTEGRA